jgi:hypothetical protein
VIIELLVGATVVAIGAIALRRMSGRHDAARGAEGEDAGARGAPATDAGRDRAKAAPMGKEEPPAIRPASPRGLRVGDVLLYADTEIWLAGEVHLDEEGFALSLFPTPGASRSTFVVQLDEHAREIAFLGATTEVPGGAIPTELPVSGMRFALRRRGHAVVRTVGEHLPLVTERCEYVVLGAAGGRALVVVDFRTGNRIALVGEIVPKEMYDLLPGGD